MQAITHTQYIQWLKISSAKNYFCCVAIFLKTEGKKYLRAKHLTEQQTSNKIFPYYFQEKQNSIQLLITVFQPTAITQSTIVKYL